MALKYKVFGVFFCLCAVVLSLAAPLLESGEPSRRYHQHWDAPVKAEETKGSGFATHLPLVEINTGGVEIPGRTVRREDGSVYYSTAADGSELISAHLDIVDHLEAYNHPNDEPTLSSDITIHVRGRSSRHFDKSSYALRLVTEDGLNNPQPVMGMDAHHEWVLHGPYLDKTLMRNYMWYNIGGEIMGYAPNVRFCEVMLNGEYQGVYVMLENLTAGDDGARLPLTVSAKDNTFSGYLLQFNGGWETDRALTNQFSYYARRASAPMEIVYPGKNGLTPEMAQAISQDFSDFEKALYSYDYDTRKYGYKSYIDTQSFIDYFLINELTCNYDAGRFSTYIGKDPAGELHMYLWDMNSSCDNYQEQAVDRKNFNLQYRPWFTMMMKDEKFTDALIQRYWELRESYFDPDYLCSYIDETAAYLGEAVDRNYDRWGYVFALEEPLLTPADRELHSYEEALEQMKDFLRGRIQWMDENIDSLRQYSAESKVKKFNENVD